MISTQTTHEMTKPITSVAAMTLYEQEKFELDDPIAKYIPAFEKTSVFVKNGDSHEIVPAERQVTVRDLFRHTAGYGYGGGGNPDLQASYEREGVLYRPPAAMMPPWGESGATAPLPPPPAAPATETPPFLCQNYSEIASCTFHRCNACICHHYDDNRHYDDSNFHHDSMLRKAWTLRRCNDLLL